jgi:hypothetical protein
MTKRILTIILIILSNLTYSQIKISKTVYFDFNLSKINANEKLKLDSIPMQLKTFADFKIYIKGYTDSIGSNPYNDNLSKDRAISVKNYLTLLNIDSSKIFFSSYGKNDPIVPNSTDDNRALNRRVEIIITGQKSKVLKTKIIKQKEDSIVPDKKDYGVLVTYGKNNLGEGVELTVINNTKQMEKDGFTTMTTKEEPLISNLIFCVKLRPGFKDCILKEPIKIRIPVNKNSFCKPRNVKYFSAEKDSITGLTKWNENKAVFSIETILGVEYFVLTITNACAPCMNFDCYANDTINTKKLIKIRSKKYKITQIKTVYEKMNALLTGNEISKNLWSFNYLAIPNIDSPDINLKIVNKQGKTYSVKIRLQDIQPDKNGIYYLKRKVFKKLLK